jgi:hypothetical protein
MKQENPILEPYPVKNEQSFGKNFTYLFIFAKNLDS